MCLPNFIEFKQVEESSLIVGYRTWKFPINSQLTILKSQYQDFEWAHSPLITELTESNSGFYSHNNYNHYNNHYNHYYYNDYNYYNHYNNNDYNYYYIRGIVHQYGKVAVHESGYRSECCKIVTLFTIREWNAVGTKNLDWIKKFNELVRKIAKSYNATTIHHQDWRESQNDSSSQVPAL